MESARVVGPSVPVGLHDHPDDEQHDDAQLSTTRRSQLQRLEESQSNQHLKRTRCMLLILLEWLQLVHPFLLNASIKVSADEHPTDAISADKAADKVSTGVRIPSDPIPSDPAVTHDEPTIPSNVSSVSQDKQKSVMMEADPPIRQRTKKQLKGRKAW